MATNLFTSNLYTIKTLTNLHVGNGEANYSVIDNQVQRDNITNFPQINASSLKGALREFIENSFIQDNNSDDNLAKAVAKIVFGSEPTENQKPKQGYVNFFDAKVLALPVRTSHKPYMLATSKEVLNAYVEYCKMFKIKPFINTQEIRVLTYGFDSNDINEEILVEEKSYNSNNCMQEIKEFFKTDSVVLMEDEDFRNLSKELPFVTRNHLENGKSENLWYEEIIPRESLFYFVLQFPKENLLAYKQSKKEIDEKVQDRLIKFANEIKDTKLFIGANTTIGYGYCEIKERISNLSYKEVSDAK